MTVKRIGLDSTLFIPMFVYRLIFNSLVVWMLGTLKPLLGGWFLRPSLLLISLQPPFLNLLL